MPLLRHFTAILCLAGTVAATPAADVAPVRVQTTVVGNTATSPVMELDAVLQPVRQATVTAQVGGNVMALRLDRCMARGLACDASEVLEKGASDHHPIVLNLSISQSAVPNLLENLIARRRCRRLLRQAN